VQRAIQYDGLRLQVHKKDGTIKLFTRNLEDVTGMFPEVVKAVSNIKVDCIIEGEGVGYNPKKKSFKRSRRLASESSASMRSVNWLMKHQ
jgi:ATP-dependent DNA ligase